MSFAHFYCMSKVNHVLIIQTAFLGDAILITSLLEKIRCESPHTLIHLLVRKGNVAIFEAYPHPVQVWSYDKSNKRRSWMELFRAFSSLRFDQVFVAQRFFGMGLLSILIGAKRVVGFDKNPLSFFFSEKVAHSWGDGSHEIERNTKLLTSWLGDKVHQPLLKTDSTPYLQIPYICISPGSVWETKRVPLAIWIEMIHRLPKDLPIVLMGAPNEVHLSNEIAAACLEHTIHNETGKHGLLAAIGIYQHALLAYVNDSGPLHICSATNTPTVAVFCSTVPSFGFGPLAAWNRVVQAKEPLACKPCGDHGKKQCPLGHFACGFGISSKELAASYQELLAARSE